MNETERSTRRRPTVLRLESGVDDAAQTHSLASLTLLPEPIPATMADSTPLERTLPRRGPWLRLALAALGGLFSLGIGLALADLVARLFAYSALLGGVGLLFVALLIIALIALAAREIATLSRLARVEHLRARADALLASDDRVGARVLAAELTTLYAARPDMARARAELGQHMSTIVDGADLVRLTERELMGELDRKAIALITQAAKRVSIVTAVAPRALFDVAMVIAQSTLLVRKLAELYGARPGGLASLKLARGVLAHLAVTGGMALGEGLVEQLLGHGLAAKLSAKLGEGLVNGMMTARVGLSTLDVVRPLPFCALERPKLGDILAELARMS